MALTTIPTNFGSGGANINPTGGSPTLKDILIEHKGAIETLQLNGGLGNSWYDLEATYHASKVSTLTESTTIPIGLSHDAAILGANATDAGIAGGALRGNSDTLWSTITKATIVPNVKTSPFAISFQGSLSPIAVGKACYIGLVNANATHEVVVATNQGADATHFIGFGYDGSSLEPVGGLNLGVADANIYTWRIYSDSTTVTIERAPKGGGAAAIASGTILTSATHFPSDAMLAGFFNSLNTVGQAVLKCLYSYVGP